MNSVRIKRVEMDIKIELENIHLKQIEDNIL